LVFLPSFLYLGVFSQIHLFGLAGLAGKLRRSRGFLVKTPGPGKKDQQFISGNDTRILQKCSSSGAQNGLHQYH